MIVSPLLTEKAARAKCTNQRRRDDEPTANILWDCNIVVTTAAVSGGAKFTTVRIRLKDFLVIL